MTRDEILALPPRTRDALVAEKVMGWRNVRDADGWGHWTGDPPESYTWSNATMGCEGELPFYSSDPAADYDVLLHVRFTWAPRQLSEFALAMDMIYQGRDRQNLSGISRGLPWPEAAIMYRRGDYALAALLVAETTPR